jgi:hypothetical protein
MSFLVQLWIWMSSLCDQDQRALTSLTAREIDDARFVKLKRRSAEST